MVLDASAAIRMLADDEVARLARRRIEGAECHAPHLFDAELGQALRRQVRTGEIDAELATYALQALPALVDLRYPHVGALADRAWALRHNLSFYDGLYVALAAELDLPLVTSDARLARAPALPCPVELI